MHKPFHLLFRSTSAIFIFLFFVFSTANYSFALSSATQQLSSNLFVDIAKKLNPAVVNVSTKSKTEKAHRNFRSPGSPRPGPGQRRSPDPFRDFYDKFFGERPNQKPKRGMGSGFVIDKEGHILTNYHVIEDADEIVVTVEDKGREKEYTATLIGSDSKTDIALVKINRDENTPDEFPFLRLGSSENLEVGEWVVAIGNPFGLSHTVTVGVVSALGRSIGAGPYDEFIQTDASINPGNSGGPLINIEGEVIGINTAIISGNTGGNVGIGFAIPINIAKGILQDLKEKGSVTRGWLGVMIQKITPELAKSFGLNQSQGALVGDVIPDGPAFKAGVKRGDVIVKFDGKDVKDMEDLPKIVAATAPNSVVDVEVIREGSSKNLRVKIEVLKDSQETVVAKSDPLGMQVQDITPELAQSLELEDDQGVLVSDVTAGNFADESGIRRGDVISEMNRTPVGNVQDYQRLLKSAKKGSSILFLVKRRGTTIYIAVKVG
ncbi:MAG: DegQ family serine endoprotease [Nitrospinae bacterium]|nr:DegQ family serine endoprotease [Nitrospinota bacterium]MZH04776.1 DegQ family serine endoprotease [Nitrospinota bacterium]MZH13188.1 DegQ family serine endoprotease [Nitrospinota bacterium]